LPTDRKDSKLYFGDKKLKLLKTFSPKD